MAADELEQLIEDLEAAHGHGTMAGLRKKLLPAGFRPQP